MFEAAYLRTLREGKFPEKIAAAKQMLSPCTVCPRECGVDRLGREKGFCGLTDKAMIASVQPHFGEESPLVGSGGSGTIFITSCNLKCVFCQNYEISHLMEGQEEDANQIGRHMLDLQQMGCHNINFVTPSHVVPQLIEAIHWAAENGLNVPIVFNTGGYDKVETLRLLEGVVDIYMPDLKFMDSKVSKELMDAPDYPDVVLAAIREMHRQVGDLEMSAEGIASRGLLVRHLVMPDDLASTRQAMRFLAGLSANTYVNIMNQYRPCGSAVRMPKVNRSVTRQEYTQALEIAQEEGINRLDERAPLRLRFF